MVCLQLASAYSFANTKQLNSFSTATSGALFVGYLVFCFAFWHLVDNKHLKRTNKSQSLETLEITQLEKCIINKRV